jgi:hypothetical protein
MLAGLLLGSARSSIAPVLPVHFSDFVLSCERKLPAPFSRFWGHRPSAGVIRKHDLFAADDPNFSILPKWDIPPGNNFTIPFTDTHVAVRFLGGVNNFTAGEWLQLLANVC